MIIGVADGLYDIYKNGYQIMSGLSTSQENTLYFSTNGGGSFEIVRIGDKPQATSGKLLFDILPAVLSVPKNLEQ